MQNQSNFEQLLQQWIAVDDQLTQVNDTAKKLRERKNQISERLNEHLVDKHMQNISVQVGNEQIRFAQVKETQPLTFKYLETCFSKVFDNEEEGTAIMDFIRRNRESKMVMDIKRSNK
jgi:hypothetical protein